MLSFTVLSTVVLGLAAAATASPDAEAKKPYRPSPTTPKYTPPKGGPPTGCPTVTITTPRSKGCAFDTSQCIRPQCEQLVTLTLPCDTNPRCKKRDVKTRTERPPCLTKCPGGCAGTAYTVATATDCYRQ